MGGKKLSTYTGLRAPAWTRTRTSPGCNFFGTGQSVANLSACAGLPWQATSHAFWTSGISWEIMDVLRENHKLVIISTGREVKKDRTSNLNPRLGVRCN